MPDSERQQEKDPELVAAIEEAIAEGEWIKSLEYDGVVGVVPNEFSPFDEMFYGIRNELLHKYTELQEQDAHESILEYMKYFEENNKPGMRIYDVEPGYKHLHYIPIEDEEKIAFLCKIKKAVSLGFIEGIRLLGGDNAAYGAKRREKEEKLHDKRKLLAKKRQKEHKEWNVEAQRLIKLNLALKGNKSGLARNIKKNLNLSESIDTIRKRLELG